MLPINIHEAVISKDQGRFTYLRKFEAILKNVLYFFIKYAYGHL